MSKEQKEEPGAISRREFLKETGIILGGMTMASLAFASSCNSSKTQSPSTSSQDISSSTSSTPDTAAANTTPANTTPASSITSTSTLPSTSVDYVNFAPSWPTPQLIDIPNCVTKAAAGYLYSADNMWVKTLTGNVVVVGMTDKFQALVSFPKRISLPKIGDSVVKDIGFGSIEGSKLNTDLISPVTGLVLGMDQSLIVLSNEDAGLQPIVESPYFGGWMLVVQMSKPDELNSLMSAQQYAALVANLE